MDQEGKVRNRHLILRANGPIYRARTGLTALNFFSYNSPLHVEYRLMDMGLSLSEAFCGVWQWVEAHQERLRVAREEFDARPKVVVAK